MMRAEIVSVTWRSPTCFYCEDPWKYLLDVATTHADTGELTGDTVEICACQSCKDTRLKKFEDRVTVTRVRDPDG